MYSFVNTFSHRCHFVFCWYIHDYCLLVSAWSISYQSVCFTIAWYTAEYWADHTICVIYGHCLGLDTHVHRISLPSNIAIMWIPIIVLEHKKYVNFHHYLDDSRTFHIYPHDTAIFHVWTHTVHTNFSFRSRPWPLLLGLILNVIFVSSQIRIII